MGNPTVHPLTVTGIRQLNEQEPPLLLLQDDLGRPLEISIGLCEALAIQVVLNEVAVGRPLTHDLILDIAGNLEAPPDHVIIDDVSNQTYYARLCLATADGEVYLDCRPSDAIAIALRADVPILATEQVMLGEEITE